MALNWFALGKEKRSRLGIWLDRNGVTQLELEKRTGLSRGTISRMCNDKDYEPTMKTAKKIITALQALDPDVDYRNFWSM